MTRKKGEVEAAHRLVERDLTQLARDGKLGAAHGVEASVTEVLALLASGDKHPLLSGEPGVGKTAIVEEVARRIADGRAGGPLAQAKVLEVSLAGVLARGEEEAAATLDQLFEKLADEPVPVIVFVRDFMVALETPSMPVVVRAIREGSLRLVLESEPRRAQEILRSDETLAERLHLVPVEEPSPERAQWLISRVAEDLEREHRIPIAPEACEAALRLATKFLVAQRMPRKALQLLRETVREAAAGHRERVGAEDVLARFCATTRLPRFVVDDAVPLDLAETAAFFGERILGQNDAVAAVLRSVALLKAGLNDPRRPLGVFLFAGPTGVGKTHLAKLLAEFLFGAPDRLVRLNMADYAREGDESVPFGDPWARTLGGRRGELTRLLDGKVFTVLLLDEFEKAHALVHDRFLQLFDEGRFINAAGETVPCNNTLVIATSNAGAEVFREPPLGFSAERSSTELLGEVDRRIASAFRTEFLNRFDAICHFLPLTRTEIRKIAQREVGRVLERDGIRARGLDVEVAPEVVDLLVERGYSPHFGARFLQREIEKTLSAALAVEIVKRPLPYGTPVRVEVQPGGHVTATAQPKAEREARAEIVLPSAKAPQVKRRLDRESLLAELASLSKRIDRVSERAGRTALEKQRAALLAQSQAPDFWDQPEPAAALLRSYRQLDAQLLDLDRVAKACSFSRKLVREAKGEQHLNSAARSVEEVAREVQLLEARTAAGRASELDDALIEIEATSDATGAQDWVQAICTMYAGWAERRGCEVSVVAEESPHPRAVLRVSGPGILGFLSGETGIHRRTDGNARLSAYVRVRAWSAEVPAGLQLEARELRRKAGAFVAQVKAEVRVKDENSGRSVVLQGDGTLDELKAIGAAIVRWSGGPLNEVRRYFIGRGARVEDPRTGASHARIKDVLRGELELFISAWVSRAEGASAPRGRAIRWSTAAMHPVPAASR